MNNETELDLLDKNAPVRIETEYFLYDHILRRDPHLINFPIHAHRTAELLMVIKGNISYIVEGKTYKLKRGDVVLSRPGVLHNIHSNSNEDYERYNVVYDEKRLPPKIYSALGEVDVFRLGEYGIIADLFRKIDSYSKKLSGQELERITDHLIEEIFYNLALLERKEKDATVNPLVYKAISYMHAHIKERITVDEICDSLYITRSHLHHIFQKNLGISPKQYLTSKRLIMAQEILRNGAKPTEVFTECGFEDYATFFRNYKKHFGYPPSEECAVPSPLMINS